MFEVSVKFGSADSSLTTFGSLIFPPSPAVLQFSIYCLVVENQKSQLVNVVSKAAEKCVPIVKLVQTLKLDSQHKVSLDSTKINPNMTLM